jgi:hypothetical protein
MLEPLTAHATGLTFRIEHSGQWCSMAEQSPQSCFNPKQTASNPETRFFSIVQQWQKPLISHKNPLPKPTNLPHSTSEDPKEEAGNFPLVAHQNSFRLGKLTETKEAVLLCLNHLLLTKKSTK